MGFVLIIQIFILSWLIRAFKSALFWIYLWQLKEYHIGRFLDHFRTYKGKSSIFNFFSVSKVFLFCLFLLFTNYFIYIFYFVLILYFIELLLFFKNILFRDLKIPKFTLKAVLLTFVSFIAIIFFLFLAAKYLKIAYWHTFSVYLLIFDILSPVIISLIVLIFQPFFVLARNSILQRAKQKISQQKDLIVIGITGSYGKTSTKEFLTTILSSKFKVLSTKEHRNSEIGIAKTILEELRPEQEVFVVEMGAYNKGGIRLLCDMVKPSIGIVTGANEQHLATFRSMKNLLSAEGGEELLNNLPKDGLLVVNGDNKYCMDLYKKASINKKVYTLSNDKVDSDIWAEEISVHEDSLDFMVMTCDREAIHFIVNILGKQNIQNLLGAILIAKELGMSLDEISKSAKNISQKQAGIILKKGIHGINIIDSSYSSNPDGVMVDLDYLNVFKGKKVIVMPCLIELGKRSAEVHRQIGKKIAEVCDMAIITTKDKFKEVRNSAVQNGMAKDKIIFCGKPKEIFNLITTFCRSDDTVLLEGRVPGELIKLLVTKEKPNPG